MAPDQIAGIESIRRPFINRLRLKGHGEYRDVSFIKDNLEPHIGDGSYLDPLRMIMEDTGYGEEKARKILGDLRYWTGDGYSGIRARDTEHHRKIADRIERFLVDSPKYEGTIWRGIGVSDAAAKQIMGDLSNGIAIDQRGLSSWSTKYSESLEFARKNSQGEGSIAIVFQLENETGVSIKHIAGDIDNDEVVMSSYSRYIIKDDIELIRDAEGDYYLIGVIEI